jgi:hypothetical protein
VTVVESARINGHKALEEYLRVKVKEARAARAVREQELRKAQSVMARVRGWFRRFLTPNR